MISRRETDGLIQRFPKIYLRTPNTGSQAHKLFNCFNIFKNRNYEQGVLTLQFSKMWIMSERGARLELLNRRKRQKEYNIGKAREIRWAGPPSLFNCGTWFRTGAITNKRLLPCPHGSSATCSKGVPPSQAQNNWWAVILFTQETWFWIAVYKSDFCADNQIWNALGNLASWTQHSSEYFIKWIMKTLPLALTSPVFMRLTAGLWVCKCVCACWSVHAYMKALFRFQADGTCGND